MTVAADRYRQLDDRLVNGRAADTLSDEEDDAILDEMEPLWWEMTGDERAEARERARVNTVELLLRSKIAKLKRDRHEWKAKWAEMCIAYRDERQRWTEYMREVANGKEDE
jgi:hypothetical protein